MPHQAAELTTPAVMRATPDLAFAAGRDGRPSGWPGGDDEYHHEFTTSESVDPSGRLVILLP